jgi:hypothetical protein
MQAAEFLQYDLRFRARRSIMTSAFVSADRFVQTKINEWEKNNLIDEDL